MLNNKGYVFVPLIVIFIFFIAVVSFSFKESVINSVSKGSLIEGEMDKCYYNYSKLNINIINNIKKEAYINLSNSSLISSFNNTICGVLLDDYPSCSCRVPSFNCSYKNINLSFPQRLLNISLDYPIKSLIEVKDSFNPQIIQDCLNKGNCNNSNWENLLLKCINEIEINNFKLRNLSVPLLIGNNIYINLGFLRDKMTIIYPFFIGKYVYVC